ncbi:MAG: hypothetical protein ACRC4M_05545 [Mycoplasma sp.]
MNISNSLTPVELHNLVYEENKSVREFSEIYEGLLKEYPDGEEIIKAAWMMSSTTSASFETFKEFIFNNTDSEIDED